MSYLGNRRRTKRRGMSGIGDTGIVARAPMVLSATRPMPAAPMMVGAHTQIAAPWKGVRRFGLGGVTSRPPGAAVSRHALGDGAPGWYQALYGAMGGASLGDDAQQATPTITDGTAQWQGAMLATTQQMVQAQQDFIRKDQMARYVQIAATLMIPLSAAVWRMIFRGGGQ